MMCQRLSTFSDTAVITCTTRLRIKEESYTAVALLKLNRSISHLLFEATYIILEIILTFQMFSL